MHRIYSEGVAERRGSQIFVATAFGTIVIQGPAFPTEAEMKRLADEIEAAFVKRGEVIDALYADVETFRASH